MWFPEQVIVTEQKMRGIRDRVYQTRRRQVSESIAPQASEQRTAASVGRSVERNLARNLRVCRR